MEVRNARAPLLWYCGYAHHVHFSPPKRNNAAKRTGTLWSSQFTFQKKFNTMVSRSFILIALTALLVLFVDVNAATQEKVERRQLKEKIGLTVRSLFARISGSDSFFVCGLPFSHRFPCFVLFFFYYLA